jgi:hypothetical protein
MSLDQKIRMFRTLVVIQQGKFVAPEVAVRWVYENNFHLDLEQLEERKEFPVVDQFTCHPANTLALIDKLTAAAYPSRLMHCPDWCEGDCANCLND